MNHKRTLSDHNHAKLTTLRSYLGRAIGEMFMILVSVMLFLPVGFACGIWSTIGFGPMLGKLYL